MKIVLSIFFLTTFINLGYTQNRYDEPVAYDVEIDYYKQDVKDDPNIRALCKQLYDKIGCIPKCR